jgi:uncharacterized membrane protein
MNSDQETSEVRHVWLWLSAILAAGLVIRVVGMDYSLWNDELASIKFAQVPLHLLWSDWMIRESNPPLYYSLLHVWIAVFGESDAAVRMLSVLLGVACVGLTFPLGRRVGGDRVGLIAAGLAAVSGQGVLYSQNARGYGLAHAGALVALTGTLWFLQQVEAEDDPRRRRWALAAYATGCVVALYGHTMLILLPLIVNGFVFYRLGRRGFRPMRPLLEWIAANLLVLLAWSWWALITVKQLQHPQATIGWLQTPPILGAIRATLESYLSFHNLLLALLTAPFALAAVIFMARRYRQTPALLLPVVVIAAPALLYLISLKVPSFLPRTFDWASGAFIVVAAAVGTLRTPRRMAAWTAVAFVIAGAGLIEWELRRECEPWRQVDQALAAIDPHADVMAGGKGVAYALQRYCAPPGCALRIHTVPVPYEGWAVGFAAPDRMPYWAASGLLQRSGTLFVVSRQQQDPAPQLVTVGVATAVAGHPPFPNNISVVRWVANAPSR